MLYFTVRKNGCITAIRNWICRLRHKPLHQKAFGRDLLWSYTALPIPYWWEGLRDGREGKKREGRDGREGIREWEGREKEEGRNNPHIFKPKCRLCCGVSFFVFCVHYLVVVWLSTAYGTNELGCSLSQRLPFQKWDESSSTDFWAGLILLANKPTKVKTLPPSSDICLKRLVNSAPSIPYTTLVLFSQVCIHTAKLPT